MNHSPARNVYFELTEAFNARAPNVALAPGQAVVYYRIAIMSKDGDWIIREAPDACDAVLVELDGRGARYRAAAPLDVRWLAGGWSSHFEFADARARRTAACTCAHGGHGRAPAAANRRLGERPCRCSVTLTSTLAR